MEYSHGEEAVGINNIQCEEEGGYENKTEYQVKAKAWELVPPREFESLFLP
jgi:hypothetical protein